MGKHSDKDSIGPQPSKMPLTSSQNVKPVSSIPREYTCLPKLFRQSLYHGHFRSGGSISSAPSPEQLGALFLFVATDKFTKRPEVTAVRKMTAQSAIKFLKELVCRFGVPARIITDNSTQFTSHAFMQYNAEVLHGLKTRTFDMLQKHGRRWIEELPVVLWSLRTTPNRATR